MPSCPRLQVPPVPDCKCLLSQCVSPHDVMVEVCVLCVCCVSSSHVVLPPCFFDSTPDTETRRAQRVLNRFRRPVHPRNRETELRVEVVSVFEKVVVVMVVAVMVVAAMVVAVMVGWWRRWCVCVCLCVSLFDSVLRPPC